MSEEQEATNLELHVAVCAERYKSLGQRLAKVRSILVMLVP
ncbi:MAG: hypothetical protein ABL857_00310 [Rickettsiales bacterium]